MTKAIVSKDAPAAVGPYSQAIAAGPFLFTSGQIALDPVSGQMVTGDIAAQTHQVMANLKAVLAAAGLTFEDVVKTTIFLQDMGQFAAVNQAYALYFTGILPARSTVQVAALPKAAQVEIEMVALLK